MPDRGDDDERFDVILIDVGTNKISVLKVVRETLGLGTAEAKHFIENVPRAVKENLVREEAAALESRLEGAGGYAVIRSRDS